MGIDLARRLHDDLYYRARPLRQLEHRIQDGLYERERLRTGTAILMAVCGGLAVLYLCFAFVGTINFGRALAATSLALGLALVWLLGFLYRARTGPTRAQLQDRERRGF